jgi:hypothetical protein
MSVQRRIESPHDAQSSPYSRSTVSTKVTVCAFFIFLFPSLIIYLASKSSRTSRLLHISPTKENHASPRKTIVIDESSVEETEEEDAASHAKKRYSQRRRRSPTRRLGTVEPETDEEGDQVEYLVEDEGRVRGKEKRSVAQVSQARVRAAEPQEVKNTKKGGEKVKVAPSGSTREAVAQNNAGATQDSDGITRINVSCY